MADPSARNRIRLRWDRGEPAIVGWLHIPSAQHAELLATLDFDGLVVDLQHSAIDLDTAVAMFTAIEARGCEPLVRVKGSNEAEIGKLLDCGAYGIIAPLIDSAADAKSLSAAVHYPPRGRRSFGPRRPALRWGTDYLVEASDSIVSLAMIEARLGLDNLDEILAVPGLDGVFIGPSDLALALGRAPAADPTDAEVLHAITHIRDRAHASGRRVGIYCGSVAAARGWVGEGFDLVSIGSDLQMLVGAASLALAEFERSPANP